MTSSMQRLACAAATPNFYVYNRNSTALISQPLSASALISVQSSSSRTDVGTSSRIRADVATISRARTDLMVRDKVVFYRIKSRTLHVLN